MNEVNMKLVSCTHISHVLLQLLVQGEVVDKLILFDAVSPMYIPALRINDVDALLAGSTCILSIHASF